MLQISLLIQIYENAYQDYIVMYIHFKSKDMGANLGLNIS